MNLYPYNNYILLASAILLLVFIIITLVHLSKMNKSIKSLNSNKDVMNTSLKRMQIKSTVIKEDREEKRKKNAWLKTALPIAFAIHTIYKKNDDMVGLKGYEKATRVYLKNAQNNRKLVQSVQKAIIGKKK